ncbi:MAG: transporter [Nitrospirae bacterium]|nr:transporter [Nitrospirota bacterium]MBI4838373.1 transporter [Nitrospirota bacterium]
MFKKIIVMVVVLLWFSSAFGAHPLITDDAGTQGRKKFQIEVNSEFSYDKEKKFSEDTGDWVTEKTTGGEIATNLSYGVDDYTDIVIGLPYQWSEVKENDIVASDEDGVSDMSMEMKWRFYEKDGLNFALKPGVTLPTGDDERGLGSGRTTYSMVFIATKEISPAAFHLNFGYKRNDNKVDERRDIWHASFASDVEVVKNLEAVANIGVERNHTKTSHTQPAFILGGLIYSVSENLDIDLGVKGGLNNAEADYTILAGIARRF